MASTATPGNVLASMIASAGLTTASHPLTYVKFLIQIGHEPIAPKAGKSWFGKPIIRLPGLLEYSSHIRKVDGWFGLYRGLTPRIVHGIVGTVVNCTILEAIPEMEIEKSQEDQRDSFQEKFQTMALETCRLSASKLVALTCAHPVHVISVRMMAQFVGRETTYRNVFQSIGEIYRSEGISGFFSGIIPHILGELISLWIFRILYFIGHNYVIDREMSEAKEVQLYSKGIFQWISGYVTYPFVLVTNLMSINRCGLSAGEPPQMPNYSNWVSCMGLLRADGALWRGSSILYRTMPARK